MNSHLDKKVFGAKASIVFQYDGTIDQLAVKLADTLNLKSLDIEASEDPPYKQIGSAEAMGWELWLEEDCRELQNGFHLQIETEHSLKESFEGNMHDLSPWLARLVSTLCDVNAQPAQSKPSI